MSAILSTFRLFTFAVQNFFRNFWLSFITITIFILTLLTINVVIFMNVVADTSLRSMEEKVEVTISFVPEASEDIVKAAQGYLMGLSQVREVTYSSREEVVDTFKIRYADNEVILSSFDEVGEDALGAELVVSAQTPTDFPFILEAVETPEFSPYIREKNFQDFEDTIQEIEKVSLRIRYAGIALSVFFGLVAMMIIFNTIRVAIYVHRDEIGIMKLVGANDWFVRGPFLLEALLYAVIATGIVVGLFVIVIQWFEAWAVVFFGDTSASIMSYFIDNGLLIFGAEFVGIVLLALLTTGFAMRKYLRV